MHTLNATWRCKTGFKAVTLFYPLNILKIKKKICSDYILLYQIVENQYFEFSLSSRIRFDLSDALGLHCSYYVAEMQFSVLTNR